MGYKDREHRKRVQARNALLNSSGKGFAVNAGVAALKRFSTNKQIQVLSDALHENRITVQDLYKQLSDNAPAEMHKGALKLMVRKKPVTVDALMEEYRDNEALQTLCKEVGLFASFFQGLAEIEVVNWEADNNGRT